MRKSDSAILKVVYGRLSWALVGVLALMALLGSLSVASAQTIKFGASVFLSGTQAHAGESLRRGAVMALEEINAAGGVNGRLVEIDFQDDQGLPNEAVALMHRFSGSRDILAVIGPMPSTSSLAAGPIAERNGIVMITPVSTHAMVPDLGTHVFRTALNDAMQGAGLADFIVDELQQTRVAVMYINNDYGVGIKDAFVQRAKERGIEIVAEQNHLLGDQDFRPQLTNIARSNPDVIWYGGLASEFRLMVKQARSLGIDTQVVASEGVISDELIEFGGPELEGVIFSALFSPRSEEPHVVQFVEKFTEKFGSEPDAKAATMYDTVYLLVEALKKAPRIDRRSLRDALANVSLEGVTGHIEFAPNGEAVRDSLLFVTIKDRQFDLYQ